MLYFGKEQLMPRAGDTTIRDVTAIEIVRNHVFGSLDLRLYDNCGCWQTTITIYSPQDKVIPEFTIMDKTTSFLDVAAE